MKTGDLIELTVSDLAFGGDGVARHDGRVMFVPLTVSGDRIQARVTKVSAQFARAELTELRQEGAGRCEPRCRYFTDCGGCQYQHMDYATQLTAKSRQLREVLARIGGIADPEILPWLVSPREYGYRNRISVHHEGRAIGFRARDGRRLVDVERCELASDEVNAKLRHLRRHPGRREHYSLREERIPELGFYQANKFLLPAFQKKVAELCLTVSARRIVECYGGAGFFTAPLAAAGREVTMIESDARLVAEAKKQLPPTVSVLAGECETWLPELLAQPEPALILLDPPREGLSRTMRDLLARSSSAGLVYVSCNPATLARDLKQLANRWRPRLFQPIDLFPQTAHFECVAVCD